MNLKFNQLDVLEKELEALPLLHQVAFATACCERLLPKYNIFSREAGWGDSYFLRTALDEVWQILEGKPVDETKLRQILSDCDDSDKISPDADDCHSSKYVAEAQRTAGAICYTLELCLEPTLQRVVLVARQVTETLFEFLDWKFQEASDSWDAKSFKEQMEVIANHPFTVREIAKQNEDLQRLKQRSTLDQEFLQWLRISSNNSGKSLIDLS